MCLKKFFIDHSTGQLHFLIFQTQKRKFTSLTLDDLEITLTIRLGSLQLQKNFDI